MRRHGRFPNMYYHNQNRNRSHRSESDTRSASKSYQYKPTTHGDPKYEVYLNPYI